MIGISNRSKAMPSLDETRTKYNPLYKGSETEKVWFQWRRDELECPNLRVVCKWTLHFFTHWIEWSYYLLMIRSVSNIQWLPSLSTRTMSSEKSSLVFLNIQDTSAEQKTWETQIANSWRKTSEIFCSWELKEC